MDRTTIIIRFQWRAYWRRLKRGGQVTAGNQGIALLISALVFVRYLQWVRLAAINLAQGKTALLEVLLVGIFVAWLFPLASGGQAIAGTRRWLRLPLSLRELFYLRVVSGLMPPAAWLVVAASLLLCYPLAHASHPVFGIIAASLFIALAGLVGLTLSHLINIATYRRLTAILLIAVACALSLFAFSQGGLNSLRSFVPLLPSTLVARAAVGKQSSIAIVMLAALCLPAYAAALWSFRLNLEEPTSRDGERRLNFGSLSFPGRLGGLIGKDFRYFRRLLDVYLGLLGAIVSCVYLVTAEAPSRGVFLGFMSIVFLLGAALPLNSFGLDTRTGLDRYSLLPLSGQSILLSKNLAYVLVMSGEVLPLLLLAGWRLGVVTAVYGLMSAAALACAYLAWGNWMSVRHPVKMQFYRFASSGAALADALAGLVFGSAPGILIIYRLHSGNYHAAEIELIVLLFGALYWTSLVRFGKRFEQRRETIAQMLS